MNDVPRIEDVEESMLINEADVNQPLDLPLNTPVVFTHDRNVVPS